MKLYFRKQNVYICIDTEEKRATIRDTWGMYYSEKRYEVHHNSFGSLVDLLGSYDYTQVTEDLWSRIENTMVRMGD